MQTSKRGLDRRVNTEVVSFPLELSNGEVVEKNRRTQPDRRQNRAVSWKSLFPDHAYKEIEPILRKCPQISLSAGEVLLSTGDENHNLYLITDGLLQVHLDSADSDSTIDILPGESVGEMSIIDNQSISAYVVAAIPTRVMVISENLFWEKLAPIPGVIKFMLRLLTTRMRKHNETTLAALEQQLRLEHLEKELNLARDIQASMLPNAVPLFPSQPGIDASAIMHPAKEVGGDFYDAFSIDIDRVCFAVGDVSGKGVPAALFMVRTLTLLRTEVLKDQPLAASIAHLNRELCLNNDSCMFVTLFVAVLDTRTGEMQYVSCGHNPPLLCTGSSDYQYIEPPKGIIAGIHEGAEFETGALKLEKDHSLVLYTDGITEAQNLEQELYGEERLQSRLQELPGQEARGMVEDIYQSVESFADDAPQFDDITLLILRYCSKD